MIGYYVHHQGRGHLERARNIAVESALPVVALSSLPAQGAPFAGWLRLPRDDDGGDGAWDHPAGGALHWAPLGSSGYRERMHRIAAWIESARPRLVVVDVSVEVAVLCRTLGVAVIVVAGPGRRDDTAHQLVHRLASRIIAPWPAAVYRPAHLAEFDAKTCYVGAFSRFDGSAPSTGPAGRNVLVLAGAGGADITTHDIRSAQHATPDYAWTAAGIDGTAWCTDVWTALGAADIVVTHAGQNALAEVAAARRPAVVVPQRRPFGEQNASAEALQRSGIATTCPDWPRPEQWPSVLRRAASLGGGGWARWSTGAGARQAARVIAETAADA